MAVPTAPLQILIIQLFYLCKKPECSEMVDKLWFFSPNTKADF